MKPPVRKYHVYMVHCANGSLYTGITTDLKRRIQQHNSQKGARYTRAFGPVKLLWKEKKASLSLALKREAEIKKWPRQKKWALIHER